MKTKQQKNLNTVFERLHGIFTNSSFQRCEGLNGEIPFFVQTYTASQQIEAAKQIAHLIKRLSVQGVRVLEINLYKICIELLEKEDVLQNALEVEQEMSKIDFQEAFNGVLDIQDELIPYIKDKMQSNDFDLIFLDGVGEAYPLIRSHNMLNNLHAVVKTKPLILFFPGEYDSFSLHLFGVLKNENYYRAFNLDEFKHK